jgi:hypothetical protein
MAPRTERRIAVDVVLGFSCGSSGWFKGPVGAKLAVAGGPLISVVDGTITGAAEIVLSMGIATDVYIEK